MPKKTTSSSPTPVRAGATRAAVYNEGLAVYLYDPANRQAVIDGYGVDLVERALVGTADRYVKDLAKQALLVAYELHQDDELVVDVVVGPPLSKDELKAVPGVKWHKPQVAVLDLPSGKLAVESANSSHIHPDDPDEAGAVVAVPPGRYVLTLYRLKWDDMTDEVCEGVLEAGVGHEFVVLTPFAEAEKAPNTWPLALPYPAGKRSTNWVGKYTVDGVTFTGQVWFWDYWEIFWLNLDRAAFAELGMGFGSVLDVETGGRRFTVAYLNQAIQFSIPHVHGYKPLVGCERTLAAVAGEPELALGVLHPHPVGGVDVLACMRVNAAEAVPQAWHEKWRKAVVTLRSERLPEADAAALGKWTKRGGVLHGEVLFLSDRFCSVNFDARALKALAAGPGDTVLLGVDGKEYAMTVFADLQSLLGAVQRRGSSFLTGETDQRWEKLVSKWVAAPAADKPAVVERMRAHLLPDPALIVCPDKHWYTPDKEILLIQPGVFDRETYGLKFTLPFQAKPGTPVTLRTA